MLRDHSGGDYEAIDIAAKCSAAALDRLRRPSGCQEGQRAAAGRRATLAGLDGDAEAAPDLEVTSQGHNDAASTCGKALRDNARVVVADVDACEFMTGTQDLEEYRRSGIRAVQSTPLQSRSGRPLGMLSTHWRSPHGPSEEDFRLFDILARQAADLIERTLAEGALRESEERFRLIANTAPVMIWMSAADAQITYVNQTWLDYTGRSLDAVSGDRWSEVLHPDDVERCRAVSQKAVERESFQLEHRLRRHDGDTAGC